MQRRGYQRGLAAMLAVTGGTHVRTVQQDRDAGRPVPQDTSAVTMVRLAQRS